MRKHKRSLLVQLCIMLAAAISTATLTSSLLSFHDAEEQVEELFDAEMAQLARLIQGLMLSQIELKASEKATRIPYLNDILNLQNFEGKEYTEYGHEYERKLALQAWNEQGEMILDNGQLSNAAETMQRGYGFIDGDKHRWRTFVIISDALTVRVAQRDDVRNELTWTIGLHAILPNLIISPILLLLVFFIARKNISPLNKLVKQLPLRDTGNLEPIEQHASSQEVDSLVEEVNKLFKRVSDSYEREKQFTADAAHELRTPLASANIHLENIKSISKDDQVLSFSTKAEASVRRLRHMVEQLLVLRRIDSTQKTHTPIVSLSSVLNQVIDDQGDENKNRLSVEMNLGEDDHALIRVDELELSILLRNLIENALKYSTLNSDVLISLSRDQLRIFNQTAEEIENIEQLFQRFSRGAGELREGSGLGLAICRAIADRNLLKITMMNKTTSSISGIEVRLQWPLVTY